MTPLPKRRHSTRRRGTRRHSISLKGFKKLQLIEVNGSFVPHSQIKQQKLIYPSANTKAK